MIEEKRVKDWSCRYEIIRFRSENEKTTTIHDINIAGISIYRFIVFAVIDINQARSLVLDDVKRKKGKFRRRGQYWLVV